MLLQPQMGETRSDLCNERTDFVEAKLESKDNFCMVCVPPSPASATRIACHIAPAEGGCGGSGGGMRSVSAMQAWVLCGWRAGAAAKRAAILQPGSVGCNEQPTQRECFHSQATANSPLHANTAAQPERKRSRGGWGTRCG